LENGVKAFADRDLAFEKLPDELSGMTFTRRTYKHYSDATIDAPSGSTVYLILGIGKGSDRSRAAAVGSGWIKLGESQRGDPSIEGTVWTYKMVLSEAGRVAIPGGGYYGVIIAARNLALDTSAQIAQKKPDASQPASAIRTDVLLPDDFPTTGPSTRPAIMQASIKSPGIGENPSGLPAGETSEVT
jgi:hypothetical protein